MIIWCWGTKIKNPPHPKGFTMVENSAVALGPTINCREVRTHVKCTVRAEGRPFHTDQCSIECKSFGFGSLSSGGKLPSSDIGTADGEAKAVAANVHQAKAILLDAVQRIVPCSRPGDQRQLIVSAQQEEGAWPSEACLISGIAIACLRAMALYAGSRAYRYLRRVNRPRTVWREPVGQMQRAT